MAILRHLRGMAPMAAVASPPSAPKPRSYVLAGLPFGRDGTRMTLECMKRFVKQSRTDPRILDLARSIIENISQKNYYAEAEALRAWVASNIRYTQDVYDVETLQSPIVTLETRHGDCDDQATLLAALLNAAGHEAKFVAVAVGRPDEFDHVLVETKVGERWLPAETTEPVTLGEYPWMDGEVLSRMEWRI